MGPPIDSLSWNCNFFYAVCDITSFRTNFEWRSKPQRLKSGRQFGHFDAGASQMNWTMKWNRLNYRSHAARNDGALRHSVRVPVPGWEIESCHVLVGRPFCRCWLQPGRKEGRKKGRNTTWSQRNETKRKKWTEILKTTLVRPRWPLPC